MAPAFDQKGFKPSATSKKKRCPHCGASMSHGLPGNPNHRKTPPCLVKKPKPTPALTYRRSFFEDFNITSIGDRW